ncbi:unnamed protein product [Owenia fusiformis]|uniref:Uncharacterized protein n=1 Tax=Owenia fusiformis TaxID=6347 RepID=A0A8J1UVM8_OWEFU|nr:unnamed protein product [Owenia fusiformis]
MCLEYIKAFKHYVLWSYIVTAIGLGSFQLASISAQEASHVTTDDVDRLLPQNDTVTIPGEFTTTLVDNYTIPGDTIITPNDKATIIEVAATTPGDTYTMPVDISTMPVDTSTIPGNTSTIPADTLLIPNDTTTALGDISTIPDNATTILNDKTEPKSHDQTKANITSSKISPDIENERYGTTTKPYSALTKTTSVYVSDSFTLGSTNEYQAPISDAALCFFKWTHTSNTCNCNSVGILSVPSNIPTNTTHLFLENNSIQYLKDFTFRGLRRLEVLSLNNNPGLEYIENNAFEGIYSLTELYLSNIGLTNVGNFLSGKGEDLIQLEIVDMSHNKINKIQKYAFHEMVAINFLDLSYNDIEALSIYFNFVGLSGLVRLNMAHNPRLHEIGGRSLVGMSAIRHLDFSFSNLTQLVDEELWGLKSLEYLDLSYTPMRLLTNRALSWLTRIKVIDLSHSKIRSIKETFKGLNINSIDLSNNLLRLIHNDAFKECPHLTSISLRGNTLGTFPRALCQVKNIEELDLSSNVIRTMGADDVLCIMEIRLFNGEGNPFTCNKDIVEFAIHMHASGSRNGWPEEYKCYEPYRWRNKTIENYVNTIWEILTTTRATIPTTNSPTKHVPNNIRNTHIPRDENDKATDQSKEFGTTNLIITSVVVVLVLLVFVVTLTLVCVMKRLNRYAPTDNNDPNSEYNNTTCDEELGTVKSGELNLNEMGTRTHSQDQKVNNHIGITKGIEVYHKIEDSKKKRHSSKNKIRYKSPQRKHKMRKEKTLIKRSTNEDPPKDSMKPYEHRHKTHVYVVTSPNIQTQI